MPTEEILGRRKPDVRLAEIPPYIQMTLSDEATGIAVQACSGL
jgi:hypothetical protein